MPLLRPTSRDFHDWRTHPVKGGPMTFLKKHAVRTLFRPQRCFLAEANYSALIERGNSHSGF